MVDATQATARVTFSGSYELGVMYPGYVMDQPITVEAGSTKYITVYNGRQSGTISFAVVFSGAERLAQAAGLVSAAALVGLTL